MILLFLFALCFTSLEATAARKMTSRELGLQLPPSYPTPQLLGKSFLAGTATDLPCPLSRHPNASGAVGPEQFVIYSYSGGRIFDKESLEIDPSFDVQVMTFFPPAGVDQRIKYDKFSDRWFLTAGDLQGIPNLEISNSGTLNIAVSDSGYLSPETKWQVFIIPGDEINPPGDFTAFELDYNNPGIDQNALYIGVDAIDVDGNTIGATVYVIDKSSLLSGCPKIHAFRNLIPATANPCGIDNFDADPQYGYILGVPASALKMPGISTVYHLYRVSRSSPPQIAGPIELKIGPTQVAYSFSAPQPENYLGINGTLGGGYTPASAHIRNNQLYFALNVPVDRFGVSGNGREDRNAIRWYQFDLGTKSAPALKQRGQLFDGQDSPTPLYYMWPAIMTNKRNDLVISYITASANSYVKAYFAGRNGTRAPDGTLGAPVCFYESNASYNGYLELASGFLPNLPNPPIVNIAANRLGDGVYTTLDPKDELTFWTIQQVIAAPNVWGLAVAQILSSELP